MFEVENTRPSLAARSDGKEGIVVARLEDDAVCHIDPCHPVGVNVVYEFHELAVMLPAQRGTLSDIVIRREQCMQEHVRGRVTVCRRPAPVNRDVDDGSVGKRVMAACRAVARIALLREKLEEREGHDAVIDERRWTSPRLQRIS